MSAFTLTGAARTSACVFIISVSLATHELGFVPRLLLKVRYGWRLILPRLKLDFKADLAVSRYPDKGSDDDHVGCHWGAAVVYTRALGYIRRIRQARICDEVRMQAGSPCDRRGLSYRQAQQSRVRRCRKSRDIKSGEETNV
jgi:hypothetical protein